MIEMCDMRVREIFQELLRCPCHGNHPSCDARSERQQMTLRCKRSHRRDMLRYLGTIFGSLEGRWGHFGGSWEFLGELLGGLGVVLGGGDFAADCA